MILKRQRTDFQQSQSMKEPDGCLWYKWKHARCIISTTKTLVGKQVY